MTAQTLRFTEPTHVFQCLQLASRNCPVSEIPPKYKATMIELEVVNLAARAPRQTRFSTEPYMYLTDAGRKRLFAAKRAQLDAAAAPVTVRS